MSLTHVSQLHRPSSSCGPNPRTLVHSLPLPHTCPQAPNYPRCYSHIHFCSQTSPHLLTLALLPLPHTGTFASAPPSLGLNTLAFQCTHTQAHSDACFTGSARTWITKLMYIHTYTRQSQGMSRTSAGPSLPAMSTYYPALLRHTALGRSLLRPHSDTTVTPHRTVSSQLLPLLQSRSPCPPSSQNSPCVCGHRHLHRCHC